VGVVGGLHTKYGVVSLEKKKKKRTKRIRRELN